MRRKEMRGKGRVEVGEEMVERGEEWREKVEGRRHA